MKIHNRIIFSTLAILLSISTSNANTVQQTTQAAKFTGINATLVARAILNSESPEGAAEIVQYQKSTGYIFAINSSGSAAKVEILNANSTALTNLEQNKEGVVTNANMSIIKTINLAEHTKGDANSIAISNSLEVLAVAMAAKDTASNGQIAFYDISANTPVFIKNVTVGVLPDMVAFSPDSTKVVVANEGEPSGDYTIDPEGSISVINVINKQISNTAVAIDFKKYNNKKSELTAQGIVFSSPHGKVIKGIKINTTVAMDLEPEYVAVSDDSSTAYIGLQENNAMAVVDLKTNTLTNIFGLGFKDWGQYLFDASDKDKGLNLRKYQNLYGMYQPDTIASMNWQGTNFIVTANEGDSREYYFSAANAIECFSAKGISYDDDDGCLSFTNETRAKKLTLDKKAFKKVKNNNKGLGRLVVSTELGDDDNDGVYEALYTYGARSFSIFNENGTLVFDSGDDIVRITSEAHGQAFNNDEDENKGDSRSDAKGTEPEALALGKINGRTIAFVGLERMSGILAYDITNPFDVSFLHYFYNRGLVEGAKITGDLGPEGMKFVPATNKTAARLIVGNEISGSIAVWEITPTNQ